MDFHHNIEHHFSQGRIIRSLKTATGGHAVKAEVSDALLFQNPVCLKELLFCHSVFGIGLTAHNCTGCIFSIYFKRARIISEAYGIGYSRCTLQILDLRYVIEIDDCSDSYGPSVGLIRCFVGC